MSKNPDTALGRDSPVFSSPSRYPFIQRDADRTEMSETTIVGTAIARARICPQSAPRKTIKTLSAPTALTLSA
jgi:hypothetical protein